MSDRLYTLGRRIAALREAHPDATPAELAAMVGTSAGQIRAALYGTTTGRGVAAGGGAR